MSHTLVSFHPLSLTAKRTLGPNLTTLLLIINTSIRTEAGIISPRTDIEVPEQ